MTPSDIRQKLEVRPFIPFIITMSSGQVYHINHPDQAIVAGHLLAVAVSSSEGEETLATLSIDHITEIEQYDRSVS